MSPTQQTPDGCELSAVSYLRAATNEPAHGDGFSIAAQRQAIADKADLIGARIVATFADVGTSAQSTHRDELHRLLAYVSIHPVTYCIVDRIDRLVRDPRDMAMLQEQLRRAGVTLLLASEDTGQSLSEKFVAEIMALAATLQSREVSARVRMGRARKAADGQTAGIDGQHAVADRETLR